MRLHRDNIVPYSRLFWRGLKLANWSKNVIGEYVCAACDPVGHYYARDYAHCAHSRVWRN